MNDFRITSRIRKDLLTVTLEGKEYVVGYKVLTLDMKSLGLRKNPNIITFSRKEWVDLPLDQVVPGKSDFGGIWLAVSLSNARRLQNYMAEKYEQETLIFESLVRDVLYYNSYRMKTSGVKLLEEI